MSARKRRSRRNRRWQAVVDFAEQRERNLFLVVFVPIVVIFIATMQWMLPVNIDAFTNTLTAHYVGTTGLPYATEHEELITGDPTHQFTWMYETERGPLSPYPPGAPYLAAGIYALIGSELSPLDLHSTAYPDSLLESSVPPVWPGSLVAAITSALAVGFLGLTFGRIGSGGQAIAGAYVAGLGTSIWSVASDQLWQHGPSIMFLALAGYLMFREQFWWAGLAFGGAVLMRPQGALVAAAAGLTLSVMRRSIFPALKIGLASLPGVALLAYYHKATSGEWSVMGGGGSVSSRLTGGGEEIQGVAEVGGAWQEVLDYLWNVFQGVIGTDQGFLLWSPFLLVLLFGIRKGWRGSADVTKALAVGSVVFLLVQYRIQIYGHATYFGYRYPLEGLTAAVPVFFSTYVHWPRGRVLVAAAALFAVTLFAVGSVTG